MDALRSQPADCVPLLQLAALGGARLKVVERCLKEVQARPSLLLAPMLTPAPTPTPAPISPKPSPKQARLALLFDALSRHLGARRAGLQRVADAPADMPSLQAASQHMCALCAALDRAPPLELSHARLLSVREWLREHLELVLQGEVVGLLFPADSSELALPTDALARLHDLATALAMLRNYVSIDVHALLNHVLAREVRVRVGDRVGIRV